MEIAFLFKYAFYFSGLFVVGLLLVVGGVKSNEKGLLIIGNIISIIGFVPISFLLSSLLSPFLPRGLATPLFVMLQLAYSFTLPYVTINKINAISSEEEAS